MKSGAKWLHGRSLVVGGVAVGFSILKTLEVAGEIDPPPSKIVETSFYTSGCRVVLFVPLIREAIRCALRQEFRIVAMVISGLLAYAGEMIYVQMPLTMAALVFVMISVSAALSIDVIVEFFDGRKKLKGAEPAGRPNAAKPPPDFGGQ